MNYHQDLKVFVKNRNGKLIKGKVLQPVDFSDEPTWWCEFEEDGHREVSIFREVDLDVWNSTTLKECTCGGKSVGATAHPQYCEINQL